MAEAANDFAEQSDAETAHHPLRETGQDETFELGDQYALDEEFEIEGPGFAERIPAILIVALALGWVAAAIWAGLTALQSGEAVTPQLAVTWIAIFCAPLALLGTLWLLVHRNSRRETRRFGETAQALRGEAQRLDGALRVIRAQLAETRGALSDETDRLIALGDEASGRLGGIAGDMRESGDTVEAKSALLEKAARTAREDMAVLMSDLPRAEEQAKAVSAGLREAGLEAHEQAASLDAQLSSLADRGKEADELAGGAAKRLAAHLARIEGVAEVAAQRLDETGTHVRTAVEESLDKSSAAVDETRRAVDAVAAALAAMVEDAHASVSKSGEEAVAALAERVSGTRQALASLESDLGARHQAVNALFDDIGAKLGATSERFETFGTTGDERIGDLRERIAALLGEVTEIGAKIAGNEAAARGFIERAGELRTALEDSTGPLGNPLPERLQSVEERAAALGEALAGLTPAVETLETSLGTVSSYVATSNEELDAQRDAVEQFVDRFGERIATIRDSISGFEEALTETDERARSINDSVSPLLIENLHKVRETATQAAEKARAAFGDIIPQTAAAIADATHEAMAEAVGKGMEDRVAEISAASERAVTAAGEAAGQLSERLDEIAATSEAIEARARQAIADTEAAGRDSFAKRVTLLIESLNSRAIDVTKILSNEVTDTSWAAYLKGDRGVFARRAVRLLDSGEAREIVGYYEQDPEFREQVNRYIHDFEAMLREVLTTRGGSPLAVTLVSSDNGKLYVALAQAIERLRR